MRTIRHLLTPALLFFGVLTVYIHNLSQSVYGGDVGDLVTASFVGGVAHPPGYPLFTFLGFLFTRIHFFPTPAFAVGIISVLAGAIGVFIFFLTVRLLTKSTWISLISSLILAFSYFYWFYSEIAEVFTLNNLFCLLLIYLACKIAIEKSVKLLPLFALVLGLSLTNHQTILFVFPTVFLIIFPLLKKTIQKRKLKIKTVILTLVAALLGFSVYIYVFIASAFHPVLNWDSVKDIPSFLHLFLRKDYGTFSAGLFATPSFLQRLILIKTYFFQILIQLTVPVVTIAVIGFLLRFRKNKLIITSLLIGFLLSGPLFIAYAGFPLTGNFYFGVNERFFVLSTLFLFYFFAFGLDIISQIFQRYAHMKPVVLQMVFLIIPLMLFIYNFPKTNLSNVFIGDTYAKDLLTPLSPNAILFVAGDTIIFNTWYEHYVVGVRPDIHVLNINGNIGSPYFSVLKAKYIKRHPHATPAQLLKGLVAELPTNGTVFSVEQLVPETKNNFLWIPHGLTLQLITKDSVPAEDTFTNTTNTIWATMHIPYATKQTLAEKSVTISDIPNSYANAMLITGNFYFSQYHDFDKAKEWFEKALQVAPDYEKTYSSLGVWYLASRKCTMAATQFRSAITLNPTEPLNYLLLYSATKDCLHDNAQTKAIENQYQNVFKEPLANALKKFSH